MSPQQVEKMSIGVWAAGGLAILLIMNAIGVTGWAYTISGKVDEIQHNQAEAKERADKRQDDTEAQIQEVIRIGRERAAGLDARIRPLEAQSAATAATLQSINQNLVNLGADIRDLRGAIEKGRPQ